MDSGVAEDVMRSERSLDAASSASIAVSLVGVGGTSS